MNAISVLSNFNLNDEAPVSKLISTILGYQVWALSNFSNLPDKDPEYVDDFYLASLHGGTATLRICKSLSNRIADTKNYYRKLIVIGERLAKNQYPLRISGTPEIVSNFTGYDVIGMNGQFIGKVCISSLSDNFNLPSNSNSYEEVLLRRMVANLNLSLDFAIKQYKLSEELQDISEMVFQNQSFTGRIKGHSINLKARYTLSSSQISIKILDGEVDMESEIKTVIETDLESLNSETVVTLNIGSVSIPLSDILKLRPGVTLSFPLKDGIIQGAIQVNHQNIISGEISVKDGELKFSATQWE